MSAIKFRLKEMMALHDIKISALARAAEIPRDSIKSILQGKSKNPRGTTLEALSRAFNCDIGELISETPITRTKKPERVEHDQDIEDSLFKEALEIVDEITRINKISFEGQDKLRGKCVSSVYQYAMERSKKLSVPPTIDPVYAEWVISRALEA